MTNAAGTASAPGTAVSAIVTEPVTPAVTAPAYVTAGQGGYTASVPVQAGSTYAWTVTGGTVTAGARDRQHHLHRRGQRRASASAWR